ncbi:Os11g0553666 [Oryza sativa Japonica Group]|uniref:Os11g0553666 protein n=1 Tax=Oryza sativa subsp. japonica TaxID=39947 RepID=A0A0P0Y363_ORYSJ|nr:hypothetical protein EE612_056115 [Oryza sativa]BAT14438.1 Os11g0553666 [Oryza sativa Japonica Group]
MEHSLSTIFCLISLDEFRNKVVIFRHSPSDEYHQNDTKAVHETFVLCNPGLHVNRVIAASHPQYRNDMILVLGNASRGKKA